MARILVCDDEEGLREFLADSLELVGHELVAVASGEEAIAKLGELAFDLLITDLKMPGISGIELLEWARREQPEVEVVVISAHGTIDMAVQAMKLGAFDFLQKPLRGPEELQLLAERALERKRLQGEVVGIRRSQKKQMPLSYGDPAMEGVVAAMKKVAQTDATVLLLGESGVGKEVAARFLHDSGLRSERAFSAINCAALSATLLESELFGHEKGAFTGANERKQGRLELCAGGTFFLDEVGELRLDLQAKLLRVLQERSFERVGGAQSLRADVRWIAATNRDLPKMIAEGNFRGDLYHRLAVFPIDIPALRERPQDIVPIATNLLERLSASVGRPGLSLSEEAKDKLRRAPWPGNVRELSNTLERACILVEGETIGPEHLQVRGTLAASAGTGPQTLAQAECRAISEALAHVGGNRRQAAEILEIGERTLYDKIKKYDL